MQLNKAISDPDAGSMPEIGKRRCKTGEGDDEESLISKGAGSGLEGVLISSVSVKEGSGKKGF